MTEQEYFEYMTDRAIAGIVPMSELQRAQEQQITRPQISQFAKDIAIGLSAPQKFIPSMYLYDALGSALFDAICRLREYECTRGELRILEKAKTQIAESCSPDVTIVELGGGDGTKARVLLPAFTNGDRQVHFHDVDVSAAAVDACGTEIRTVPRVQYHGHVSEYLHGVSEVINQTSGGQLLVLFLGSSIGNYGKDEANAFLRALRSRLRSGDLFLLGTDLVKEREFLLKAYSDPQGVTAAFNKNVLARINAELGGDFDLSLFRHEARWVPGLNRIEMHLVSESAQYVEITAAAMLVRFAAGESIHTESSHKYQLEQIAPWLAAAGFAAVDQWVDDRAQFATTLSRCSG